MNFFRIVGTSEAETSMRGKAECLLAMDKDLFLGVDMIICRLLLQSTSRTLFHISFYFHRILTHYILGFLALFTISAIYM